MPYDITKKPVRTRSSRKMQENKQVFHRVQWGDDLPRISIEGTLEWREERKDGDYIFVVIHVKESGSDKMQQYVIDKNSHIGMALQIWGLGQPIYVEAVQTLWGSMIVKVEDDLF